MRGRDVNDARREKRGREEREGEEMERGEGEKKRKRKQDRGNRDLDFSFDDQERECQFLLVLCHHSQSAAVSRRSECEHQEHSSSQHHDSTQEMNQLQNHNTILITPRNFQLSRCTLPSLTNWLSGWS